MSSIVVWFIYTHLNHVAYLYKSVEVFNGGIPSETWNLSIGTNYENCNQLTSFSIVKMVVAGVVSSSHHKRHPCYIHQTCTKCNFLNSIYSL